MPVLLYSVNKYLTRARKYAHIRGCAIKPFMVKKGAKSLAPEHRPMNESVKWDPFVV
jgi:hypothetical protein